MNFQLVLIFGSSLICGLLSSPLPEDTEFTTNTKTPPAPENFSCAAGSTTGSAVCTWDAVTDMDETDSALGYTIRFWTKGAELSTAEEKDFPARATSGAFSSSSASANDVLAAEIRFFTADHEGEISPTVFIPMSGAA